MVDSLRDVVNSTRPTILSRRVFQHSGETVEEIIFQWTQEEKKLCWCYPPFEEALVDGKANPVLHVNYSGGLEDAARSKVTAGWDVK